MKRVLLSIMILSALLLAGCQKNLSDKNGDLVPVVLTTQVNAETKAPVISGSGTFTPTIVAWEATKGSVMFNEPANWQITKPIDLSAAENISTGKYYHSSADYYTTLIGFHPASDQKITDGKVSFAPDKETDVMTTDPATGNKETSGPLALQFHHRTSQVYFSVVTDEADYDNSISRLEIVDAYLPNGIDFTQDGFPLTVENVEYLQVKDGEQAITTKAVNYGNPVMIMPFNKNTFKINVKTTAKQYENIQVKLDTGLSVDNKMREGVAYHVTLTFRKPTSSDGIFVNVGIDAWQEGTGSALLQ